MSNLNIDINLLKLSRTGVATIHGLRCLVIPTDENDINISQDAQTGKPKAAYFRMTAWANKNGVDQYGHSHYVKQSFSKDYRNAHPDANRNAPILGNGKLVQMQNTAAPQAQPPITSGNTMIDYSITSVKETKIMDVFFHEEKNSNNENGEETAAD